MLVHDFGVWIPKGYWPVTHCPACGREALELVDGTTWTSDSAAQQKLHRIRASEEDIGIHYPDVGKGVFGAKLKCLIPACGEPVAVTGDWRGHVYDLDDGLGEEFLPKTFHPALSIIQPPSETPGAVLAAIKAASSTIWVSPGSAANALRQAVEALLRETHPHSDDASGKRVSLGQRLGALRATEKVDDEELAKILAALQQVGNAGSHGDFLSTSEVLAVAEILDLALRKLFDERDTSLVEKAQEIVKKYDKLRNQARGAARTAEPAPLRRSTWS